MPNWKPIVRERPYSPQLSRLVVCALYHEAKAKRKPMTRLADELLREALQNTVSMSIAQESFPPQRASCSKGKAGAVLASCQQLRA